MFQNRLYYSQITSDFMQMPVSKSSKNEAKILDDIF